MERTEAHHAPNGGLCGSPALLLHWAVADQGKSDDRRWSRAQSPRPGWLAEGLRRGCAVDIARGQSRGPNVEMPDSGGRWLILDCWLLLLGFSPSHLFDASSTR